MLTQAQVGRFELRDFLGRGAIGDVYLAHDPERRGQDGHDGEIALKLVRTRNVDRDMVAAERNGTALQSALAQVAPQVAAVFDQGDQDGFYWVAMEYVAGDDLAKVIDREGPFTPDRSVGIALQLCGMLEIFHEFSAGTEGRRGIVHGDLKPENIRLQEADRVRVLDFGIAKHLSTTRRFTVNLFGSLPYTPPERLSSGHLDAQSDLWAVGVILYLMMAGYPPYSGQDPEEIEACIRRGDPPAPLPESLPEELRKIVCRTLAFEPARRYASAAALRSDLEAWKEGRPLPAETDGIGDAADARPEPPPGATRRTVQPLEDSTAGLGEPGGTRRTFEPEALPPVPPPISAMPSIEPARPRLRLSRRWLFLLIGALLVSLALSQLWVQSQARDLQRALVTDTEPDLEGILARYRKVSWLGLFNPAMGAVRDELREALVTSADRVLEAYHAEVPRVRERNWQEAYNRLQGALELNYLDRKTRAKMLYARGHLDRIASQGLRQRGETQQAEEKVDSAVADYRDAMRYDRNWPDPYLGLARVYSYERPDLGQLQKALAELEKRGYHLGRRERAMEADGYRRQAEGLWVRAQSTEGDGEAALLEQTRDSLLQAINFYDDAEGYGEVRANRAKAQHRLEQVQDLLDARDEPDFLEQLDNIFHQIERQRR